MKETLDEQSRLALIQYRIERAEETIEEASLLSKESHFNAAINRLYYACFYAASALMVAYGLTASSHAGVKTMIGMHLSQKAYFLKNKERPSVDYLKYDIVVIMMTL